MKPDFSNPEKARAWFQSNNGLSTYELAMLANRSPSTIRNWKRRAGLVMKPSPFPKARTAWRSKVVQVIDDPSIWDNAEWFRQKYLVEGIGTPTIARMINRSIVLVVKRLKRFNIKTRPHREAVKSKSEFCNLEWLTEFYVNKKWSLKKCARVAGVVSYTIYNWLVRFKIAPRTPQEAMAGALNPFFGRKHTAQTKEKIRQAILRHATASQK
jgi:transposase